MILDKISPDTIVLDEGSDKTNIANVILTHPNRSQYVAAHPLAGTEFSGSSAGVNVLFRSKKNIISDSELSSLRAVYIAVKVFDSIGMDSLFMTPSNLGKHLAYMSHLSNVSSFVLGLTVLDMEKHDKNIFDLSGAGFESTVGLSKSSPTTWSTFFDNNKENLVVAIDIY